MSRDRDLAHWIGDLAIFDPETGGAAAIVAGDAVDAGADQIGDVEALLDVRHQLGRRYGAGFEMQIIRAWRWRRGNAAMGMAGRRQSELPRGCRIEQPGGQNAVVDDRELLNLDALGIKGLRAQAAQPQRIVNDTNVAGKKLRAEMVLEETRLARDRGAVDRVDEMADQRVRHARIVHDGHLAGLDLARIGARNRALPRSAADAFGR